MKAGRRRRIGRTAIEVTEIGLGGAPLGNHMEALSDEEAGATIEAGLGGGVCYFDTAPKYGYGLSERRMGNTLRHHDRDGFVLSTKVGCLLSAREEPPGPDDEFVNALPFAARYDYSYDAVMRSVEDSLQRLALNRIDILLMHDVDTRTHGADARAVFAAAMEGGHRALDSLRGEGVIGAFGLGVNEWEVYLEAMRHGDFDCFLVAGRYTLLDQGAVESMLPECERRGVSMIVGGPFNSGILATGAAGKGCYDYAAPAPEIVAAVRALEAVCGAHAVPLAAAALQFPLGHPAVATVVPGARSTAEVKQNLALFETPIPERLWSDLKGEGLLHADAPTPGGGHVTVAASKESDPRG